MKKLFTNRLSLLLVFLSVGLATYAGHDTHYSKAVATAVPSAAGKVYVGAGSGVKGSSNSASQNCGGSSSKDTHTYCFTAETTDNGYTWDGWYDQQSGGNKKSSGTSMSYNENVSASSTSSSSPTTINRYARWTANTYTVTFDPNEGTVNPTSQSVTYASTYGNLPTPTRRFYDFNGWFTESAAGTQVTADTKVTAKSNHTLYAHWTLHPEDQTLSWGEGMQFNMAKGSRQPISVTATSGLSTFTYESDKEDVIAVDGEYLVAVGTGDATITVRQAGNDFYNPASLQATFTVLSKETPYFTANGFSDEETNELKVGQVVTLTLANISDGLDGDFTITASENNVMDFVREGNVVTFTAAHAGETTITVAQAETDDIYAASKSYSFNVSRYVPEFTLGATELELEQTAQLNLINIDAPSISFQPEGVVSYDGSTGVITAVKPGTTALTIEQPLTNSIEAKEITFTITVSKKTPSLTIKMNGTAQNAVTVKQGGSATVNFDKISDAEIIVTNVSGEKYASFTNGKLQASSEIGKATYRATLPETDLYKGTSADFSMTVENDVLHLPMSFNNDLWNNSSVKVSTEGSVSWDNSNGVVLGSVNGGGFDSEDKYIVIHFNGIPDKLTFGIAVPSSVGAGIGSMLGGISNVEWFVKESATSSMPSATSWTSTYSGTDFQTNTVQLDPSTRYVLLCYSGNFGAYYKNISISELKYVKDPEPVSVDFGSAVINSGVKEKEININWCNIAPLSVTCDNPRFTVSPSSFGSYEQIGSQTITVGYTHTNEAGTNEGTITVSNGTAAYTKTIPVRATTTKRPQTITWNATLVNNGFAMNIGEQYPDDEIAVIATATNGGDIVFESDNEAAVSVTDGTILSAVAIGQANIIAIQAGDNEYQEVRDTVTFVVTDLRKQTISWDQDLYGLLTTDGEVELDAHAESDCDIDYTSNNEEVVRVEGRKLIIVGKAGEAVVTAHQRGCVDAEGVEWLSISKDNYVIVRDPNADCNGYALTVTSQELNSGNSFSKEYTLAGTPQTLTFSAYHGEKEKPNIWTNPTYAALMVDKYIKVDGVWSWVNVYNAVVGTSSTTPDPINLEEGVTKIRFRTTETGTTHTLQNIRVSRKKLMGTSVKTIDEEVESNAIWQKSITIAHSNIDFMTISTENGLLNLSTNRLGDGCNDYTDDEFTISFTPTEKNQEYLDKVIITDGKAKPSTITIPVRLYSKGLNQSISGFDLPTTAVATDEIVVSATANSGLDVVFTSSDDEIAYVADGKLVILSAGTVTITASQEGNEKYDAAPAIEKTIVISKAATSITTAPTAEAITYGQPLEASALVNGAASVDGTFAWETPATVPAAGTPTYNVIFTPAQDAIYATASTLVTVRVEKATPTITTAPTASDITIAQKVGDSELADGVASVAGAFAWKNPNENRLKPGTYERTVVFTPEDENYNSVEILVSFNVINVLARIDELPTAVCDNPVYGITLADVTLEGGSANVAGSFAWADSTTVPQAGEHNYAVTFTPEDLELYAVVHLEVSLTVAKADPEIIVEPTGTELTYGAKLGESELYDGEASVDGQFQWVDPEDVLPVSYYFLDALFVPADTLNYNTVEVSDVQLEVLPAELKVIAEDKEMFLTTPVPEFTAVFEGFVNDETLEVLGGELTFSCGYADGSEAGEYAITPQGLTSNNYDITFVPGTLTVNEINIPVTIVTEPQFSTGLAYNGESQALLTPGEVQHGVFEYSFDNETFTEEVPVATNAGDYTIYVRINCDQFYVSDYSATEVVTIAKIDPVITLAPAANEIVYDGEAHELITAGQAQGGTLEYALSGEDFSTAVPKATEAGIYRIAYRVVGDENHNDLTFAEPIKVVISDPNDSRYEDEITWEQELGNMKVGDQLTLTAWAWVDDVFYFSSDETVAYVENGILYAVAEGTVTITAYTDGDSEYKPAEPVEKELTVFPASPATSVDEAAEAADAKVVKIIRNDQLLIIRNGRTYTATGLLQD